jgi:hypothetical protein
MRIGNSSMPTECVDEQRVPGYRADDIETKSPARAGLFVAYPVVTGAGA